MMRKRILLSLLAALLLFGAAAHAEVPCSYYSANGDHDWVQEDVTMPTCTSNGYIYLKCAVCGTQDTLVNPAYGHSWEDTADVPPTCTSSGWRIQECANCHETRKLEIPKLEHEWVQAGYETKSTCTVKGSRMEECVNCGQMRTIELPLIDHEYGPWIVVVPATDHSAGTRARTCEMCGQEETHYYYMDGTLYRGGPSGKDVADLQQMLIDLHYLNDVADGSFGKKTEQAVQKFQQAAGLEVTGVAFPQTIAALAAEWGKKTSGTVEIQPGTGAAGGTDLSGEAPPFCIRTPEEGGLVRIDYCAQHGALWQQEYELRSQVFREGESVEALRASVSLWLEEIDDLFFRWESLLPEADKPLAVEARNAFAAMLTTQEKALTAAYGENSPETLLFELDILHEQVTTLCGYLNMIAE